jgi:4-diphosphocytidyl-2-C-methyl-D-erythritol kinase
MRDRAYAKINISLDVVGKREDGYHELNMVMLPVTFYDVVDINFAKETSFISNVKYISKKSEGNTVLKAIEVLRDKYYFVENFEVEVKKHIPTRAGLGGGSADAAATIRVINKMLHLNMSIEEMLIIGKKVGADVPFCIENKPALVKGIGEKIEKFKNNCDFWLILVKPRVGISTKKSFAKLDLSSCEHPNCELVKDNLINNNYEELCTNVGNSLEQPSFIIVPKIKDIKNDLVEAGCDVAIMSGSGSTVFGLSKSESVINKANDILKNKGYFVRKVKILK